jgi:hypothetical protein
LVTGEEEEEEEEGLPVRRRRMHAITTIDMTSR